MDIEEAKQVINEVIEKSPTKDAYEKCLLELISEKSNIMSKQDYDKTDKLIESIQMCLSIPSK
jgi:hypothetical protein